MKKTIQGILYDSTQATPLCCAEYSCGGKEVQETAYCAKGGHYFVVQAVGGKESSLFPMSNEDMADWTERFLRDVKGIWPGPQG